jgi:hypothetical protein
MATTDEAAPPAKVARVGKQPDKSGGGAKKQASAAVTEAMNVIIQFQTSTGESTGEEVVKKLFVPCLHVHQHRLTNQAISLLAAGPQLDVPATVTPEQLEVLLNGLLQTEEKLPYSFYLDDQVNRLPSTAHNTLLNQVLNQAECHS